MGSESDDRLETNKISRGFQTDSQQLVPPSQLPSHFQYALNTEDATGDGPITRLYLTLILFFYYSTRLEFRVTIGLEIVYIIALQI